MSLKGSVNCSFFMPKQKFGPAKQKNRASKRNFEGVKQNLRQICKNSEKVLAIFPNMDIIRIVVSTQSK